VAQVWAGKEIRIGKKFIGPNHPLKASIVGRQTGSGGIVPEDQVPELLARQEVDKFTVFPAIRWARFAQRSEN
jgi:hypothetical protein